jgi:hypothetical protein
MSTAILTRKENTTESGLEQGAEVDEEFMMR